MSALDECLNRTEGLRKVNNEAQLLLSHFQTHKQVLPSTISDWIKNSKILIFHCSQLNQHVEPQLQKQVLLVDK